MVKTRSMSSRRETAVAPPPLPKSNTQTTRSMSSRRKTSVDPPPPPTSPAEKIRTGWLRPFSRCPIKSAILKKQHQKVLDFIKQRRAQGYKPPTVIDFSKVQIVECPSPEYISEPESEDIEDIERQLGGKVIRDTLPPLTKENIINAARRDEERRWIERQASVIEVITKVIKLPQRDIVSLLLVSGWLHDALISTSGISRYLDFGKMNNAGDRLVKALSMRPTPVGFLEFLNLNGCEKVSNRGVTNISKKCPRLKHFSISGNLRVTDFCIKSLAKNCAVITDLNLSGCKKLTDESLVTIGNAYHELESLDISRCEISDAGIIAIAEGCQSLKFLNLSEIDGVTDRCLNTLSKFCSKTLTTIDANGCTGIKRRSREEWLQLFPNLQC